MLSTPLAARRAADARGHDRHRRPVPGDARHLAGVRGALRRPRSRSRTPPAPGPGPSNCCGAAKVAALERALAGADGWVTGIRREQSPTRADAQRGRARRARAGSCKYNPLAHWTEKDLWRVHRTSSDLPYNPLHDQGYDVDRLRAVHRSPASGREGRWAGTDKTECGLHVDIARRASSPTWTSSRPRRSTSSARSPPSSSSPVLLFSGGKDSIVLLRLAEKAFRAGAVPFPVMHVDTGPQLPRGASSSATARVEELGVRLIVASVQDSIDTGRAEEETRAAGLAQPAADRHAARRDRASTASTPRSAARAATRSAPARRSASSPSATTSAAGTRAPSDPSCGTSTTAASPRRARAASFPISNWTELDVWQYIARGALELPSSTSPTSARCSSATGCSTRCPTT